MWHTFDWQLPLVLCDLKPILKDFIATATHCVTQNITGVNVDYSACLTDPDTKFIKNSGECIKGTLTDEDLKASFNLVKAYTSFVKNGCATISKSK